MTVTDAQPPASPTESPSTSPATPVGGIDTSRIPAAPRPVTPVVSRRTWFEPRITRWVVAVAVLAALFGYLASSSTYQWMLVRKLILSGDQISARIVAANGFTRVGMRQDPTSIVELAFQSGGKDYKVGGPLVGRSEFLMIGDDVPIRVNPENPRQWTYRTEPPQLAHELAAPSLVLIPLAAVIVALVLGRRSLLTLWSTGTVAPAIIADLRSSAIAPTRPRATCLVVDGDKRLTVSVNLAPEQRHLKRQDVLAVVYNRSGKAVPVAAFDGSLA
jgi:hypothetical protein